MVHQQYATPTILVRCSLSSLIRVLTDQLIAFDSHTGDAVAGSTFSERLDKPWASFQEHRFDWIQGLTTFYEDNAPKLQMRKNVPTHVCFPNSIITSLQRLF